MFTFAAFTSVGSVSTRLRMRSQNLTRMQTFYRTSLDVQVLDICKVHVRCRPNAAKVEGQALCLRVREHRGITASTAVFVNLAKLKSPTVDDACVRTEKFNGAA